MIDKSIGNFKILSQVGTGGMSRVYLAVHKDIPSLKVILKLLTVEKLADRFKQEADKLALLEGHPNICRIRDFFDYEDNLVIAMEYVDGRTLEETIATQGPYSPGKAVEIMTTVLDVISFAHSRGIYHRDIKPSNIMIDSHDRVKVIDFGIAKAEADPDVTSTAGYVGTPSYMAPEQFESSSSTNYALIDIYCAGSTLYEMLCGKRPFESDNLFLLRDAKLNQSAPRPSSIKADIPKPIEIVVEKSLERDPEHRFQSAEEMKTALEAAAEGRSIVKRRRSKSARIAIAATIIVPIIVLVVVALWINPGFLVDKKADKRTVEQTGQIDEPATSPVVEVPDSIEPEAEREVADVKQGTFVLSVNKPSRAVLNDTIEQYVDELRRFDLPPGNYRLTLLNENSAEGSISDTITVASGETLTRSYRFSDTGAGTVRVSSSAPELMLIVNEDTTRGVAAPHEFSLPEGSYEIVAVDTRETGRSRSKQFSVNSGENLEISFDFITQRDRDSIEVLKSRLADLESSLPTAIKATEFYGEAVQFKAEAIQLERRDLILSAIEKYDSAVSKLAAAEQMLAERRNDVLDVISELESAFKSRNIEAIVELYPSLPSNEVESWNVFFQSVESFDISFQVDELQGQLMEDAQAILSVNMEFEDTKGVKNQDMKWRVDLAFRENKWIVTNRQTI